jgi:hypothetical protein
VQAAVQSPHPVHVCIPGHAFCTPSSAHGLRPRSGPYPAAHPLGSSGCCCSRQLGSGSNHGVLHSMCMRGGRGSRRCERLLVSPALRPPFAAPCAPCSLSHRPYSLFVNHGAMQCRVWRGTAASGGGVCRRPGGASSPPSKLPRVSAPCPRRCCVQCGRVLEDTAFSADVTFAKDAGGESTVVGQFVSETGVARGIGRIHGGRVYAYQADSHEKAQQRGRQEIAHLVDMLSVRPREESIEGGERAAPPLGTVATGGSCWVSGGPLSRHTHPTLDAPCSRPPAPPQRTGCTRLRCSAASRGVGAPRRSPAPASTSSAARTPSPSCSSTSATRCRSTCSPWAPSSCSWPSCCAWQTTQPLPSEGRLLVFKGGLRPLSPHPPGLPLQPAQPAACRYT